MLDVASDDRELLMQFTRKGSHEAFAALVRRHTDMVYSTARRILGDEQLAEDAAQAAFLVLHHKAAGIGAAAASSVAGFLYMAAQHAARNIRREQLRRRQREQEAAAMRTASTNTQDGAGHGWSDLQEIIDGALAELPAPQRDAIVLRCMRQLDNAECARELQCSEKAFSMRLSRGLEALRAKLTRRNAAPAAPALLLIEALSANCVQAAPPHLSGGISAACLSSSGSILAAATAKGVLNLMFWSQVKTAMVALLVLALVGAGATAFLKSSRAEQASPRPKLVHAAASLNPGGEPEKVTAALPALPVENIKSSQRVAVADPAGGTKALAADPLPVKPEAAPAAKPEVPGMTAEKALAKAKARISEAMGKEGVDWDVAAPADKRLPDEIAPRKMPGEPGVVPIVNPNGGDKFWVTIAAIDLKKPAESMWWEFQVMPDGETIQRIMTPMKKFQHHRAGSKPDIQVAPSGDF